MRKAKKRIERACMQQNHCSHSNQTKILQNPKNEKCKERRRQRSETFHVNPNVKQWDIKEMKENQSVTYLIWIFPLILRKKRLVFYVCFLGGVRFWITLIEVEIITSICTWVFVCTMSSLAEGQSQVGISAYVLVYRRERERVKK